MQNSSLSNDTLVSTANQIERLRIDRPGYWRRGYVTHDPAELVRLHEEAVVGFRIRGWTVAAPTLEEAQAVAARRSEEHLRESGKARAFQLLQNALLLMGGGAAMAGVWMGFNRWTVH